MILTPQDRRYADWLDGLKDTIRQARVRTSLAVNAALIGLYWTLGREILSRQKEQGWGAKVVDQVAADLGREFPYEGSLTREPERDAGFRAGLAQSSNFPTGCWKIAVGAQHAPVKQTIDRKLKGMVRRAGRHAQLEQERTAPHDRNQSA